MVKNLASCIEKNLPDSFFQLFFGPVGIVLSEPCFFKISGRPIHLFRNFQLFRWCHIFYDLVLNIVLLHNLIITAKMGNIKQKLTKWIQNLIKKQRGRGRPRCRHIIEDIGCLVLCRRGRMCLCPLCILRFYRDTVQNYFSKQCYCLKRQLNIYLNTCKKRAYCFLSSRYIISCFV